MSGIKKVKIKINSDEEFVLDLAIKDKWDQIIRDIEFCTEYLDMGIVSDLDSILERRSKLILQKDALDSVVKKFQEKGCDF